MNDSIKMEIEREIESFGQKAFDDERARRIAVSDEFKVLVEQTRLLKGGIWTSKNLCDSIKLLRRVQNISPMILPKIVGNYHYNVNFKGYTGTEDDFIRGNPKFNGTSGYKGVNLKAFSNNIADLLTKTGNEFADAYVNLRSNPNVGPAMITGYLNLFDFKKYPLINNCSKDGLIKLTGKLKKLALDEYCELEKTRWGITSAVKHDSLRNFFAFCHLMGELLAIKGLRDFHDVDILLWRVQQSIKKSRYFAISFGEEDISKWDMYVKEGYHAMGWDEMDDLTGLSEEDIEDKYTDTYPDFSKQKNSAQLYSITKFVELEPGDHIIANYGNDEIFGVGEVMSGYYYERKAPSFRHRVKVKWVDTNRRHIPQQGSWAKTLKVLSEQEFKMIVSADASDMPKSDVSTESAYSFDQLLADTYCEDSFLRMILSEIERKKNVIFYGPPGTGKTFVAKKMALYLSGGDNKHIESVQFHQSMAYEDFLEGIRPASCKSESGQSIIEYPVCPGIFKTFCEKARSLPGRKFVIVIDEFNRGNISKIFGELLSLLEYRTSSHSIRLPYSKELFSIPDNVYLIATMNTADKSLTHVDLAMRRRFACIWFNVDLNVLLKWGRRNSLVLDDLASLINEINGKIDDEDYSLGISYFMNEKLPSALEGIWRHEIYPYLKDYWMGDERSRPDEFIWEKVKPRLRGIMG